MQAHAAPEAFYRWPAGIVDALPALFFVSYMLVASLVLINIIIAVLLDEFLTTMARSRSQMKQEEANHEVEARLALLAVTDE